MFDQLNSINTTLTAPGTEHVLSVLPKEEVARLFESEPLRRREPRQYSFDLDRNDTFMVDREIAAYPVVHGIPILLKPEALMPTTQWEPVDLTAVQYQEAYEEMAFYTASSDIDPDSWEYMSHLEELSKPDASFTDQLAPWIDSTYEASAQLRAYSFIGERIGGTVLQVGGLGLHALKFILAGASMAWLLTPVLAEAQFATKVAEHLDVADRLRCVVSVGEEIPFASGTFDAIYSGGCMHHTQTDLSFAELNRVLVSGGRLAAIDPWKAPGYAAGIRIFGKREPSVHCRPLDSDRVKNLKSILGGSASITLHGALTRYPLLALRSLGLSLDPKAGLRVASTDDAISKRLLLSRFGSTVAITSERQ